MINATQWYLLPVAGRLCRDPISHKPLDAAGEWKPKSGYWRRRVRDGDATPKGVAAKTAEKPSTPPPPVPPVAKAKGKN